MARKRNGFALLLAVLAGIPGIAFSEETDADLAQELTNPVADLVTIPFQMNFDRDVGPADDGRRFLMNIQPVIPIHLNDDWNLITRTIIPVIDQSNVFPGAGSQSGLGDTVLTTFFSPKTEQKGDLIWGVGPVFLLPTATDSLLGTEEWGAAQTSGILFCSRLSPIPGRAHGPYRCRQKATTTGKDGSGRFRSTPHYRSWCSWGDFPSTCRAVSATGLSPRAQVPKAGESECRRP